MTIPLPDKNYSTSEPSSNTTWHIEASIAEIDKMWKIFSVTDDQPLSIRAFVGKKSQIINRSFTALEFPSAIDRKTAFAQAALELNRNYNVYTVMNPIRADFDGDLAVNDNDISCRDLLLIDLDRAISNPDPATDLEIADANRLADSIADFLAHEHGVDSARTMSGNGVHLYVPLNSLPNDEASKLACQQCLINLGRKFNTPEVKVDQCVFNASRITKVPGTVARRGTASVDRPYRMACVL